MRRQRSQDVLASLAAVVADALALFAGYLLATVARFDSGWIPIYHGTPPNLYPVYIVGSAAAAILLLFVFRARGLYVRPQTGSFINKIPRIFHAMGTGTILIIVMAFAVQNEVDYSRLVVAIGFVTASLLIILERFMLYKIEFNLAVREDATNRVLIIGCDSVAVHVKRSLMSEPMLRSKVVGYLRTGPGTVNSEVAAEEIRGDISDLERVISGGEVDQVIVAGGNLGHEQIVDVIMACEKNLVTFNKVPDLFSILTSSMDVQSLSDIPLLGIGRWPLDYFWNRVLKRTEDIIGSVVGIIVSAPVLAVAAVAIKRGSKGPALFRQERCGEDGKTFMICKLRTMAEDAEKESGPVWAVEDDPRCSKTGRFLRRHNLDELPQLWNVLKGEMSLVGPRPERPHFVEKFKEDVGRYMWRHVSKPGMTGWAQVNGLRGNTSVEERIKYDLYYLENWSIAFDFKILLRTFFATKNAY